MQLCGGELEYNAFMRRIFNGGNIRWFAIPLVFFAVSIVFLTSNKSWASAVHAGGQAIGGPSSASLTASAVCPPGGGVCSGTLTALIGMRVPYAATLNQLYAFVATAPASGSSCSLTVRKSTGCTTAYASTALACTVTGNGSTKTCQNTGSTITVAAGDCIQILYTEVGTCNGYVNWGFEMY